MPPGVYFASKSYQSPCRTISPGWEAVGSRSPITEHSTSSPAACASTIARESWASAASTAAASSCGVVAFPMPTEEPSATGLTNTGRPSAASSASAPSRSAFQRSSRTPAGPALRSLASWRA